MRERTTERKYSMKKAAELISVHVSTVSRLMDRREIGYYQIGSRRVIGQTHLEAYLARVERGAKVKVV